MRVRVRYRNEKGEEEVCGVRVNLQSLERERRRGRRKEEERRRRREGAKERKIERFR